MGSSKAGPRLFAEEDLAAVHRLICETIDFSYHQAYSASAINFFKAYHQERNILDDSKNGFTIVIEKDHQIMATGTLLGNEIKRMFVSQRMQGHGLGRELMEVLIQRAMEMRLERVYLDSSTVSDGFYRKLGFRPVSKGSILLDDGGRLDYSRMYMDTTGSRSHR